MKLKLDENLPEALAGLPFPARSTYAACVNRLHDQFVFRWEHRAQVQFEAALGDVANHGGGVRAEASREPLQYTAGRQQLTRDPPQQGLSQSPPAKLRFALSHGGLEGQ